MRILVKFPVRSRKDRFFRVIETYQNLSATDVRYLVTIDDDDTDFSHYLTRFKILALTNTFMEVGHSRGKIEACNRDIDEYVGDCDIILLASDDMIPQVQGWDQIIINDMMKHYPDTDGVLHYNDGHMGRKLNTLCIMGRKYYERFGYIYHPDYMSLFADNEFTEVSYQLGKATYIENCIIKHEHPMFCKQVKEDALYKKNNSYYLRDKAVYEKRKKINFELAKYNIFI